VIAPLSTRRRSTRFFVEHHQAILVATLCLILAIGVRIDRILLNTFPTGGDNGGHLGMPAYVRRVLAPQFRLTGWSNDWFAGVPILALYFPLPTWLIIALDTILPYSIAYKLVTVAGTILLPWAAWRLGRKASLAAPAPLFLAMASLAFLLNRSYRILGGNILSTMAGEFSFSLGLLFCVLYFGSLLDVIRHDRHRVSAVLLLAATGLSHVVPAMLAVAGTGALLLCYAERSRLRRQTISTLTVGGVGLLLAGFWIVPFASLLPYTNSMDYERNTLLRTSLLPFLPGKHTLHVLPDGGPLIAGAFVLAIVALVWGVWRRVSLVAALGLVGASAAVGFMAWPTGSMWNNRLLPLWFFAMFLLAGIGAAAIVGRFTRSAGVASFTGVAVLFIALAPTFDALPGWFPLPVHAKSGWRFEALRDNKEYANADLPFGWAATNAEGMQRKKAWPEYRSLMTTLGTLPCGRLFWEQDKGYVRFGSSMSLMAIPFFTKSCIQSVEGLYFESTQTTPFSFLTSSYVSNAPSNPQRDLRYGTFDIDRGVDRLRRIGARYLLASSDRLKKSVRTRADLREVARSGSFIVYEIADYATVQPLTAAPVVVRGASSGLDGGFMDLGLAQWADASALPDTYVVDGPSTWPRADLTVRRTRAPGKLRDTRGTGVTLRPARPPVAPALDSVKVTNVDLQPTSLRFRVDRVGVPVLVRMSWSPGWHIEGAKGIHRAAPNFFVVTPSANEVRITMGRTEPELIGHGLSAAGLIALGALAVADRRRRSSVEFGGTPLATEGQPERPEATDGTEDARDDGSASGAGFLDRDADLAGPEASSLETENELGVEEVGPEEAIGR
jgi:hypothetical protein